MRLHHFVGGSTGPGYSLMRFDSQEKNLPGWNDTSFIRDKCCHLTLCFHLMEPHSAPLGLTGFLLFQRYKPTIQRWLTLIAAFDKIKTFKNPNSSDSVIQIFNKFINFNFFFLLFSSTIKCLVEILDINLEIFLKFDLLLSIF